MHSSSTTPRRRQDAVGLGSARSRRERTATQAQLRELDQAIQPHMLRQHTWQLSSSAVTASSSFGPLRISDATIMRGASTYLNHRNTVVASPMQVPPVVEVLSRPSTVDTVPSSRRASDCGGRGVNSNSTATPASRPGTGQRSLRAEPMADAATAVRPSLVTARRSGVEGTSQAQPLALPSSPRNVICQRSPPLQQAANNVIERRAPSPPSTSPMGSKRSGHDLDAAHRASSPITGRWVARVDSDTEGTVGRCMPENSVVADASMMMLSTRSVGGGGGMGRDATPRIMAGGSMAAGSISALSIASQSTMDTNVSSPVDCPQPRSQLDDFSSPAVSPLHWVPRNCAARPNGADGASHTLRVLPLSLPGESVGDGAAGATAVRLDGELGVCVASDGKDQRCVPVVYDGSSIAQYWLAKAANMDAFLTNRVCLDGAETLRAKVDASLSTIGALLNDLNAKKVVTPEDRYRASLKVAVDKIIYEVSRRHLDAAAAAKAEAEAERLAAEQDDFSDGGDELVEVTSVATFENSVGQRSDSDIAANEHASGDEPNAKRTNSAARQMRRKSSRKVKGSNSPKMAGRQRRSNSLALTLESEGGFTGTAANFHSNLQTILDRVEPSEALLALVEGCDDTDDERDAAGNNLSFDNRRPSAFETDPFAIVSERAAKSGFTTLKPGGHFRGGSSPGGFRSRQSGMGGLDGGGGGSGVDSFLADRTRSFAAGGTLVLPNSVSNFTSFDDASHVRVSRRSPQTTSVPTAQQLHKGGRRPSSPSDGEDSSASKAVKISLQTLDDQQRLEETTCLADVANQTVLNLKRMEEERTFPEYLHLQEFPHLRPAPRPKEALLDDVVGATPSRSPTDLRGKFRAQRGSAIINNAAGTNSGGITPNDLDDVAGGGGGNYDDMHETTRQRAHNEALSTGMQQQQQQQQHHTRKKRALDLNNLAKLGGEGRNADGLDGISGGGGSPRQLEQAAGVKGVRLEHGSLDQDIYFAYYGEDPFEMDGVMETQPVASPTLPKGQGGATGIMLAVNNKPGKSSFGGVSPSSSPLPSPITNKPKVFYKSVRYWVKNVSTQDVVALYLTVDPKRQVAYDGSAVGALKAPNRPNAYVARVYPMSMVQLIHLQYRAEAEPASEGAQGGGAGSFAGGGATSPAIVPPEFFVSTIVIQREKRVGGSTRSRGGGAAGVGEADDASSVSAVSGQQSETTTPTISKSIGASFNEPDGGPLSSRGSVAVHRRSQTNRPSPQRGSTANSAAADSGLSPEDIKKQERALLLKQAMEVNQRRRQSEDLSRAESTLSSANGESTLRLPKLHSKAKKARGSMQGNNGRRRSGTSSFSIISTESTSFADVDPSTRRESVVSNMAGGDGIGGLSPERANEDLLLADIGGTFVPQRVKRGSVSESGATALRRKVPRGSSQDDLGATGSTATAVVDPMSTTSSKSSKTPSRSNSKHAPSGGGDRRRTAVGGTRRRTSNSTRVETCPLFSAGGIEATVTTESELSMSHVGDDDDGHCVPEEDEEYLSMVVDARRPTKALLAPPSREDDDEVDEAALYDALFADGDDDGGGSEHGGQVKLSHRPPRSSVSYGGSNPIAEAALALVAAANADAAAHGKVDLLARSNHSNSEIALLDDMRARSNAEAAAAMDADMSPAMRALLNREAKRKMMESPAPPAGAATPTDDGSFEKASAGVGGGRSSAQPSVGGSFAIDASVVGSTDVDNDVLQSVGLPHAVEVLGDAARLSPDQVVNHWRRKTARRHSGGGKKSPQHRSVSPSRRGRSGTSPRVVASRADHKNAIVEGLFLSAAAAGQPSQGGEDADETDTDNDVAAHAQQPTILAFPSTPAAGHGPADTATYGSGDEETQQAASGTLKPRTTTSDVPTTTHGAQTASSDVKKPGGTAIKRHALQKRTKPAGGGNGIETGVEDASDSATSVRERLRELAHVAATTSRPLPSADHILRGTDLSHPTKRQHRAASALVPPPRVPDQTPTESITSGRPQLPPIATAAGGRGGARTNGPPHRPGAQARKGPASIAVHEDGSSTLLRTSGQEEGGSPTSIDEVGTTTMPAAHAVATAAQDDDNGGNNNTPWNPSTQGPIAASIVAAARPSPHGQSSTDYQSHLRSLFDDDPDAFSEVVTDLTNSIGKQVMGVEEEEDRGNNTEMEGPTERASLADQALGVEDSPAVAQRDATSGSERTSAPLSATAPQPPPSEDLKRYVRFIPPPSIDPVVAAQRRQEAERLLAEQAALDAFVADIVDEVSKLWPSLAAIEPSRKAEFFQVSMDVAWRAQNKRAVNLTKLIAMLDRKVSARGWLPRYNLTDELVTDEIDDANGWAVDGQSGVLRSNSSTVAAGSPKLASCRSAGGAAFGRRRGSATTLHKALSDAHALTQARQAASMKEVAIVGSGSGIRVGGGNLSNSHNASFAHHQQQRTSGQVAHGGAQMAAHIEALPPLETLQTLSGTFNTTATTTTSAIFGGNGMSMVWVPAPPANGKGSIVVGGGWLRMNNNSSGHNHAKHHGGSASGGGDATNSGPGPTRGGGSDLNATRNDASQVELPVGNRHLLFGAHFPWHPPDNVGDDDASISTNARAAARLAAVRRHRLTYHLSLRLGFPSGRE